MRYNVRYTQFIRNKRRVKFKDWDHIHSLEFDVGSFQLAEAYSRRMIEAIKLLYGDNCTHTHHLYQDEISYPTSRHKIMIVELI